MARYKGSRIDTHYIPRYYLRGFCQNSGEIWGYDKQQNRSFLATPAGVAKICGFYSSELESYLTNEIENPANKILDKIRNREQLSLEDKIVLSKYIAVMWKRIPVSKERFKERAPKVIEELRKEYHRDIEQAIAESPERKDQLMKLREQVDDILDRYSQEPPESVWFDIIRAESTPRMIIVLALMNWKFLTFDERPDFLTCDNPVFIIPSLGIGRINSELSFPICSHITLWATWQPGVLEEDYFPVTQAIVKELNRRIAYNTTRFAFHAEHKSWILPFLSKSKYELHHILLRKKRHRVHLALDQPISL